MINTSARPVPTIADLWRELRVWLADALRHVRGPAAVLGMLTRRAQAAVKARLQFIESLLLKLLLIEAARLPRPNAPHSGGRRAAGAAARQSAIERKAEAADAPSTWRVRFRPRLGAITRAPDAPGVSVGAHSAFAVARVDCLARQYARARALARRLEALRRVIAKPHCAIAALARRLRRFGANAHAAAHAIALARPRRAAPSMALAHALVYANDISAVFADSS